jgi:hypothetical protein
MILSGTTRTSPTRALPPLAKVDIAVWRAYLLLSRFNPTQISRCNSTEVLAGHRSCAKIPRKSSTKLVLLDFRTAHDNIKGGLQDLKLQIP